MTLLFFNKIKIVHEDVKDNGISRPLPKKKHEFTKYFTRKYAKE